MLAYYALTSDYLPFDDANKMPSSYLRGRFSYCRCKTGSQFYAIIYKNSSIKIVKSCRQNEIKSE